jgi:hypothetical protein
MGIPCERCKTNGVQRVLTFHDVKQMTEEGKLLTSLVDPWTMALCLKCASNAQRGLEQWAASPPDEDRDAEDEE